MTRLKHPNIKNLFITVEDERVAAHVAVGWLVLEEETAKETSEEAKPKTRKPTVKKSTAKKAAAKASETAEKAEDATSTGDGEE